jgi:hypothetical protein
MSMPVYSGRKEFTTRFARDTETPRRKSKCGVYFVHGNTVAKINATVSWRKIKRGRRGFVCYSSSSFSWNFSRRGCGNFDHGIPVGEMPATLASLLLSSRCLCASSEAGGKSFQDVRITPVFLSHYTR